MIKVDDLDGILESVVDEIPDPFGAITYEDGLTCGGIAAFHGLVAELGAKVGAITESGQIGAGERIALGLALRVEGLRKDTPHLNLTCLG